nr:MAG TPA: hypothetical protein [Caudoviricetes sp.]
MFRRDKVQLYKTRKTEKTFLNGRIVVLFRYVVF